MPTKNQKEKRITFRVSESEYQQIESKAEKAGMTVSAYVRAASLKHKITVVDGLKEFTIQLKAMGRNLNQLVKLANLGHIHTARLDEVQDILCQIYEQLTKLIGKEER